MPKCVFCALLYMYITINTDDRILVTRARCNYRTIALDFRAQTIILNDVIFVWTPCFPMYRKHPIIVVGSKQGIGSETRVNSYKKTEEPESLAAMEDSVCQVARGGSDVTLDGVILSAEGCRARLDDDLQLCTQELRDVRGSAAATVQPGPTRHLMGQVQGLWERVGVHQNLIDALAKEKTHARDQCDQMAAAQTNAKREIVQLRSHNEQLQKENETLRQELLAARATPHPAGPPSVSSESSTHSGLAEQERIKKLIVDANQNRGQREALLKENEKLKNANTEWRTEERRQKL